MPWVCSLPSPGRSSGSAALLPATHTLLKWAAGRRLQRWDGALPPRQLPPFRTGCGSPGWRAYLILTRTEKKYRRRRLDTFDGISRPCVVYPGQPLDRSEALSSNVVKFSPPPAAIRSGYPNEVIRETSKIGIDRHPGCGRSAPRPLRCEPASAAGRLAKVQSPWRRTRAGIARVAHRGVSPQAVRAAAFTGI
jgi:hypothetical protein